MTQFATIAEVVDESFETKTPLEVRGGLKPAWKCQGLCVSILHLTCFFAPNVLQSYSGDCTKGTGALASPNPHAFF
jgi:hypothetical protein